MAYSKATLIKKIRALLNDNPYLDACTEDMDTTETGLDVTATSKYNVGDVVEFQDDGEQCLVTALASSTTLTVIRNHNLSVTVTAGTGTVHSTGALIAKRPVFSYVQIVDAISSSIDGLWPYVWKKVSVNITPVAGQRFYELDEGTDTYTGLEISSVVQATTDATPKPFWYGTRRTSYPYRMHFSVPTSIAGSGVAIEIPFLRNATNAITVNALARITDTVATSNYSDLTGGYQALCVTYYAVARLVSETGITRVTQEDVSMSDESVRPGVREQVAADWERKAEMERYKWRMELDRTIPRKGKRAGDGT